MSLVWADIDGNGSLNIFDILQVLKVITGAPGALAYADFAAVLDGAAFPGEPSWGYGESQVNIFLLLRMLKVVTNVETAPTYVPPGGGSPIKVIQGADSTTIQYDGVSPMTINGFELYLSPDAGTQVYTSDAFAPGTQVGTIMGGADGWFAAAGPNGVAGASATSKELAPGDNILVIPGARAVSFVDTSTTAFTNKAGEDRVNILLKEDGTNGMLDMASRSAAAAPLKIGKNLFIRW